MPIMLVACLLAVIRRRKRRAVGMVEGDVYCGCGDRIRRAERAIICYTSRRDARRPHRRHPTSAACSTSSHETRCQYSAHQCIPDDDDDDDDDDETALEAVHSSSSRSSSSSYDAIPASSNRCALDGNLYANLFLTSHRQTSI